MDLDWFVKRIHLSFRLISIEGLEYRRMRMKTYLKLGSVLFLIYAVVMIFLVATAVEMEILLALNFGVIGFVVLIAYFVIGFVYVRVESSRRVMWVIVGFVIIYGIYFFLINLANNTGAPRWF
jgi:hypothetical protein